MHLEAADNPWWVPRAFKSNLNPWSLEEDGIRSNDKDQVRDPGDLNGNDDPRRQDFQTPGNGGAPDMCQITTTFRYLVATSSLRVYVFQIESRIFAEFDAP